MMFKPVDKIPDERLWFQKKWKPGRLRDPISTPKFLDDQPMKDGHEECKKLYPVLGQCERCEDKATERHHKDRNPNNNVRSNVEFLCIVCHALEHVEDRQHVTFSTSQKAVG